MSKYDSKRFEYNAKKLVYSFIVKETIRRRSTQLSVIMKDNINPKQREKSIKNIISLKDFAQMSDIDLTKLLNDMERLSYQI